MLARRSALCSYFADVDAVDFDGAVRHIIEARNQDLINVDLPEPVEPMIAVVSPYSAVKEMLFNTFSLAFG